MKKTKIFVGIDVSKLTLDICVKDQIQKSYVIDNSEKAIQSFFGQLVNQYQGCSVLICLENTGKYSWKLMNILPDYDLSLYIVNPLHLKRSLGLVRGKNDKIDAIRITDFLKKNYEDLKQYIQERTVITEMKILLTERKHKVLQRKQLKVKNIDLEEVDNYKITKNLIKQNKRLIAELTKQIKTIEAYIKGLIKEDSSLKTTQQLLKSIPGVGDIITWYLIVRTNEFKAITDPRKFACYCGVAPFENRSGTSVFGKPRVSLLADKKIKRLLHMGAMRAIQMENDLNIFYLRKVEEGKNKMSILNAVRNKIIHIAFALIKNQNMYQNRLQVS